MRTSFNFLDDGGEIRLHGTIDPEPATTSGGTITGALDVAYAGADPFVVPLQITGSPGQTPAADVALFQVNDGSGAFRFDVESNGSVNIVLDGGNTGIFSVIQGATTGAQFSVDTSTVGFYGVVPTTQPVVPLTLPTVQNVIDALVALGLVAQHD